MAMQPKHERLMTGAVSLWAVICLGAYVLFLSDSVLVSTFRDDAFYYFQIARNLGDGNGFTFDGVHQTNGFHPLWLFLITPIFSVFDGDIAPLRAVATLELCLVGMGFAGLFQLLRKKQSTVVAVAAVVSLSVAPRPGPASTKPAPVRKSSAFRRWSIITPS